MSIFYSRQTRQFTL